MKLTYAIAVADAARDLLAEEPSLSAHQALERASTSMLAQSWDERVWITAAAAAVYAALEIVCSDPVAERLHRAYVLCLDAADVKVTTTGCLQAPRCRRVPVIREACSWLVECERGATFRCDRLPGLILIAWHRPCAQRCFSRTRGRRI